MGCTVMIRPSNVLAGKWGASITLWKPITKTKTETDDDGEEIEERFFVLWQYSASSTPITSRVPNVSGSVLVNIPDAAWRLKHDFDLPEDWEEAIYD